MNELLIRGLTIDWSKISDESYLRNITSIRDLDTLTFHKNVTFFVGENGSGKSTLLEAMAISYGFNPEGGTRNYSFSTYDSHSELCDALRLIKNGKQSKYGYFLRAESFYNVASKEEDYSRDPSNPYPSLELHKRSHGESFLCAAQNYFTDGSVYLLDEPEAALSPQRQLTLLLEIYEWAHRKSQFFIVTHSPILMGLPDAEILSFDEGKIHPCEYEDTDSYKITKTFINHKEDMLRRLLQED